MFSTLVRRRVLRRACTVLVGLAGIIRPGVADTHSWTGAASQNFQTASNWSPTGPPIDGDTANLGLPTANAFLSAATRVDRLNVTHGALLRTNGQTLKVDDVVTLNKTNAEDTALTLSSGAAGIDLDANTLSIVNGARLILEPDSQLRVVEGAAIGAGSSVSGTGQIEITGVLSNGFVNNGTLTSQGLTLRRGVHAGSTFDLDGSSEVGAVNVTGLLNLTTGLADDFDGQWDQQFASQVDVVDFTLGSFGEMRFFGGAGPTLTTMEGRNLVFEGEVDVQRAAGFSQGETQWYADTMTFGDGSRLSRALDTTLSTQGSLFLGDTDIRGQGMLVHYGDLTVTGDAHVIEGQFFLDTNDLRKLTIEPGASFVVEALNAGREIYADVEIGQNGLLSVSDEWTGVFGAVALRGSQAIFRSQDPIRVTGSPTANVVTGSGRFEANTILDSVVLEPGDGDVLGSLYFDRLTLSGGTITRLDIGPSGAERIDVAGGATIIAAAIQLSLVDGFSPEPGSVFPLLTASSLTGEFTGLGIDFFGVGPGQFFALHYDFDRVSAYVPLAGDSNFDGVVSGADYTIWADNFGRDDAQWFHGDYNGDGLVSGADYTIWADHFGDSVAFDPNIAPVPEPSAWLLAAAALGCGVLQRLARRARRVSSVIW